MVLQKCYGQTDRRMDIQMDQHSKVSSPVSATEKKDHPEQLRPPQKHVIDGFKEKQKIQFYKTIWFQEYWGLFGRSVGNIFELRAIFA